MSPFDLNGPAFLLVYGAFCVVVTLVLRRVLAHNEAAGAWEPMRNDPYLIAYLRAGPQEAVKLAAVSLIDRGLLQFDGAKLSLARADAAQFVQRDIEREVLRACVSPVAADRLPQGASRMQACVDYRRTLVDGGFLAGPATYRARVQPVLLAVALLVGVSVVRAMLSLARGHHNLAFLFVLTLMASSFALWQLLPERTGRGAQALADLRTLFARLQSRSARIATGGASNEMALLAAVFGLTALSPTMFPYVRAMYGPKKSDDGGASSSGCGSSDGGSDGGGGGCGGGCGGCGS